MGKALKNELPFEAFIFKWDNNKLTLKINWLINYDYFIRFIITNTLLFGDRLKSLNNFLENEIAAVYIRKKNKYHNTIFLVNSNI